ncbi:hypothetical protein QJS04_geneDACA017156 [Acorus gramineus]|uniref:Serine/threonine-protein kinase 11-interacting protein n=1 Tax=Acorus gramineus TaxID=55184 RepID=A0AAV9BQ57_ACOGR|nr:hypothetical protein QJS04_geneDACA017156 [Acorus gramineus]
MAAPVTGDRYLDHLVRFVERQAGPLLEGTLVLKLNPVGLRYVQSRLEALEELEGLLAGAPVDYLRAYVSDLGDHRALEQLRRILRLLPSLKVVSALPPPAPRDPTPLSLNAFGRLRSLELRGCDLSTLAARGLLELRHTLERIVCHDSTDALRHVFTSRIVDIKDSPLWKRLSFVSCACNGMVLMDESLQLLPVVETLDLSRNRFAKVDNLHKCVKLKHLDLGFNQLRTIASLSEVTCQIVNLVLRNNALTTLRGIENLKSVEGLDLSYNIISNFSELEILSSLSSLNNLWLEGNPICCARWYRVHVFSFLTHPEKLKLDDKGINAREFWERHIIIASRQKRPAGYGFYHPAKDVADDKSSFNATGKRLLRLACIEDDEQRRYLGSDGDQDTPSGSDNPRREENPISDGEAEIVDLMNRVEFMKKERSVLWLREFKEWMDQNSGDVVHGKFVGLNMDLGNENYINMGEGHKVVGESSKDVLDMVEASEEENPTCILGYDTPPDASIVDPRHGYLDSKGKAVMNSSSKMAPDIKRESEGVEQEVVKPDSDELTEYSSLEVAGSFSVVSNNRINLSEHNKESPHLTAINKIMESRSSSIYPGSPPHFQEDILHRRQYLEEEYMQLSVESHFVTSSDSDTSCSDDDSFSFWTSMFGYDQIVHEGSKYQFDDDDSNGSSFEEVHDDMKHGDFSSKDDMGALSVSCSEQLHRAMEHSNADLGDPCFNNGSVEPEKTTNGSNRNIKQKPKKRLVSLVDENSIIRNAKMELHKLNGILGFKVDDMDGNRKNNSENGLWWLSKEVDKQQALLGEEKKSIVCDVDSGASETCREFICCDCLVNQGSDYQEREVVVLLSSENKLYIMLVDEADDGSGVNLYVLGCHKLEELKEVVVGLGLQALRVFIERDATYLFITRTIEGTRRFLSLLRICDSSEPSGCSLRSWEQVQVRLFEKHICGAMRMGILLYSVMMYWQNSNEGDKWLPRSLFVVEGYILVCIENYLEFGSSIDVVSYFSLDSCCPIRDILEMIIELEDDKCVTLTINHVVPKKLCIPGNTEKENVLQEKATHDLIWKLKWYTEEMLLKFVALVKAINSGIIVSSERVSIYSLANIDI